MTLLSDDRWIGELIAPLIDALTGDPWFEPPFRVSRDPLRIGAVIFDSPSVSITATVLSADALATLPTPRSVVVSGRLSITRYVRAGRARLRFWEIVEGICSPAAPLALADGMVVRIDGRTRAHLLEGASADVVTITATLRDATTPYAREYDITTGALMLTATNDDRAARTQMLLAYLRLAGRADAGRVFDAATRDPAFFLRWAAMREWLAVDAVAASARLHEMAAADPHAEVRAAATATLPLLEPRRAA